MTSSSEAMTYINLALVSTKAVSAVTHDVIKHAMTYINLALVSTEAVSAVTREAVDAVHACCVVVAPRVHTVVDVCLAAETEITSVKSVDTFVDVDIAADRTTHCVQRSSPRVSMTLATQKTPTYR